MYPIQGSALTSAGISHCCVLEILLLFKASIVNYLSIDYLLISIVNLQHLDFDNIADAGVRL